MSESPPSCFIASRRYGAKKGNYLMFMLTCLYACVKGVLAFIMLMLILVLMSYKKS